MEQHIRFCTSSDGTRIAYATVGQGWPVISIRPWFTHLEFEWENSMWRSSIERLSARHLLIRHDARGMGLSDHQVSDYSPEAQVRDLEAVVDALGLERFALYGISQGGATCITYAVRYPERVSHLILQGSFARMGWFIDTEEGQQRFQTALSLMPQGWGSDLPAYRQFFTSLFMPDADAEAIRQFNEMQRISASPENAAAVLSAIRDTDVSELLSQVRAPTLVVHCRGDAIVPFEAGRELAAGISGARFLPLDSKNHALQPHESAAEALGRAVNEFLGEGEEVAAARAESAAAGAFRTVLFTDVEGSTALTQRLGDAKAREVLRNHERIVREALRAHGGSEVKTHGRRLHGLASPPRRGRWSAPSPCSGPSPSTTRRRSEPMRVRIGLNAGEPIAEDEDLFGTAVNLAARIAARAEGGEILASDVVRQLVAGKGFLFSDRGDVALRGFEDPVRLYERAVAGGGLMEQQIRFCTTSDGVRIAYATVGQGPPLVRVLGWFTHLEFEWENPIWRGFIDGLSRRLFLVRYDGRGMGLSDRDVKDYSLETHVRDLEAVVDAVGFEKVAMLGFSQGGPAAIAYAVRHPARVSHLILYGSFARQRALDTEEGRQQAVAMGTLIRQGWGSDSPAYRQFFTGVFMPDADSDTIRGFNELQRVSASADDVVALAAADLRIDVRELLPQVAPPTLVIHRRGDTATPFELGRELAAGIPGARFLPLDGRNHAFFVPNDPVKETIYKAIEEFVGVGGEAEAVAAPWGLCTILFTDVEGSTALTERLGDAKAREVLRKHERIVREALQAHGGAEVKAMGDGFMASFSSATRALECAIAMQRAFAAAQRVGRDEPISVRIGLNAGEPIAEDEDLFGTAVNLAARIAARRRAARYWPRTSCGNWWRARGSCSRTAAMWCCAGFEDPVRLYEVRWGEEG